MNREVKLPSGAILKIQVSPFVVAKNLYQAILRELKEVPLSVGTEMPDLFKSLFCIGFSSPAIEACLWECFKRCTYNGGAGDLKIDEQTFEATARREDYLQVCVEVARENVAPFAKSLFASYDQFLATTATIRK